MSSINFSGIISGLDTSSIISKLISAQSGTLNQIKAKETTDTTQATAYQTISADIVALKSDSDLLARASTYSATQATPSDTSVMTATASSSATPGTYQVVVQQLAQAGQVLSQGYSDETSAQLGTGTVTISLGGGALTPITVDSSNNSLSGLATAINTAGLPVTAAVVNDGSSTDGYHLVLTSTKTGAAETISVASSLTGGTAPKFTTLQAPQDAKISIGDAATSLVVSSATNTVTSVVPGVTLQLAQAKPGETVNVVVAKDTSAIGNTINDFITNYNALVDELSSATKSDTQTSTFGPLQGDPTAIGIQSTLANQVSMKVAGADGIQSLADLGITMGTDGHLSVSNSASLNSALSSNLSGVEAMFSDSTTGLATQLSSTLASMTDPTNGSITLQTNALTADETSLQTQATAQQGFLDQQQAVLQTQFDQMESAMASLQEQSQYITDVFNSGSSSSSSGTGSTVSGINSTYGSSSSSGTSSTST